MFELNTADTGELYRWLDTPTKPYSRPDALRALLGQDANRIRTRLAFELQAI